MKSLNLSTSFKMKTRKNGKKMESQLI